MTLTLDVDDTAVLDNAAWYALTGPHASFAIGNDLVLRYPEDVSPFVVMRSWHDSNVWDALAEVAGPGSEVRVPMTAPQMPSSWGARLRAALTSKGEQRNRS